MSPTLVTTLAVLVGIGWLAFIGVSVLRRRGPEEIPSNLSPGITDDTLETRRLERMQMAAVLLAGFLAVGLSLYYLFEGSRQVGFEEQFHEESVLRGERLVTELGCYGCHGPDGVGGSAAFTEKRTGALVLWSAPPLNDIFYRYGRDEVVYWVTYGRGNTPMPAWGTAGSGPLTTQQVDDIVNYLEENQVGQAEAAAKVEGNIDSALTALLGAPDAPAPKGAEAAVISAIVTQRQLIAGIERAPQLEGIAADIAQRAREIFEAAGEGIDSDGDGLSDASEEQINAITAEAKSFLLLPGVEDRSFAADNPQTGDLPDAQAATEMIAGWRELASSAAPILGPLADRAEAALALEGDDGDGDGLTDATEKQLSGLVDETQGAILPQGFAVTALDSLNPESQGGKGDEVTAAAAVSSLETVALNAQVNRENQGRLLPAAQATLDALLQAQRDELWEFDFQAIADRSFDGDAARAERVVGIFNAYCARCHTSGFSAGPGFAQEAGSGGFGPALWQGRPAIQFLSDEELAKFLLNGAEVNKPYGVNGFGSGRMPGFGKVLSEDDLLALATWLRDGDLTGKGDQ